VVGGGGFFGGGFALKKWLGFFLEGNLRLKMREFAFGNAAPEGMWVQAGEIELPFANHLYAPKKYKQSVRNAIRQVTMTVLSNFEIISFNTCSFLSGHPVVINNSVIVLRTEVQIAISSYVELYAPD